MFTHLKYLETDYSACFEIPENSAPSLNILTISSKFRLKNEEEAFIYPIAY